MMIGDPSTPEERMFSTAVEAYVRAVAEDPLRISARMLAAFKVSESRKHSEGR